jgi:hypothetical protein
LAPHVDACGQAKVFGDGGLRHAQCGGNLPVRQVRVQLQTQYICILRILILGAGTLSPGKSRKLVANHYLPNCFGFAHLAVT